MHIYPNLFGSRRFQIENEKSEFARISCILCFGLNLHGLQCGYLGPFMKQSTTESLWPDCQIRLSSCNISMWDFNSKKFLNISTIFVEVGSWSSRSRNRTSCLTKCVGYGEIFTCQCDMNSAPVQTPQQQQEVNGFKDGSMVTRYTLDLCNSTCSANSGKHPRQGRLNQVPQRHEALAQTLGSDLIRYRDPVSPGLKGLWSLNITETSNELKMFFMLYQYVPVSSRHWN